jgi:predicted nuclease of predicted toxin-antitoxin system
LKLLFDANLSPKLVHRLAELFPGSVHVFDTGMARFTSDVTTWEYGRANGFTIVTADSDFLDLAKSRGAPPTAACHRDRGIGTVLPRHPHHPSPRLNRTAVTRRHKPGWVVPDRRQTGRNRQFPLVQVTRSKHA